MRKKHFFKLSLVLSLVFVLFVGCSSNRGYANSDSASYAPEYTTDIQQAAKNEDGGTTTGTPQVSDKIVYTYNYNLESTKYDETKTQIDEIIKKTEAIILNSYENSPPVSVPYNVGIYYSNTDYYRYGNLQSVSYTVRVHGDNVEEFKEALTKNVHVLKVSQASDNITSAYVDIDAHIASYKLQEEKYAAFYEKAETVEEMLQIEAELSRIIREREDLESQIRNLDSITIYHTFYISLAEVYDYSSTEFTSGTTVGERISRGFSENMKNIKRISTNFLIWFIVNLVFLVPLGIILYFALKYYNKRRKITKEIKSKIKNETKLLTEESESKDKS